MRRKLTSRLQEVQTLSDPSFFIFTPRFFSAVLKQVRPQFPREDVHDDEASEERNAAPRCSAGLQAAAVVASESNLLDKFLFPFEDVVV